MWGEIFGMVFHRRRGDEAALQWWHECISTRQARCQPTLSQNHEVYERAAMALTAKTHFAVF